MKTQKIKLAILTILFIFSIAVATISALVPLHQIGSGTPIPWQPYLEDDPIPQKPNIPTLGDEENLVFWHFVITARVNFSIEIKFTQELEAITLIPYKTTNGSTHYGILTPTTYTIENGWVNGCGQFNFNLSHTATEQTTPSTSETTPSTTETTSSTTETTPSTTETTSSTTETTTGTTTTIETTITTTTTPEITTTTQSTSTTTPNTTPLITTPNTTPLITTTDTTPTTTYLEIPETGEDTSFPTIGLLGMAAALIGGTVVYTARKKNIYDNGKSE